MSCVHSLTWSSCICQWTRLCYNVAVCHCQFPFLLQPDLRSIMVISIGSDCSGIGTDAVAMSRLDVKFRCLFASDSNAHCRDVLLWSLFAIMNQVNGNKLFFHTFRVNDTLICTSWHLWGQWHWWCFTLLYFICFTLILYDRDSNWSCFTLTVLQPRFQASTQIHPWRCSGQWMQTTLSALFCWLSMPAF